VTRRLLNLGCGRHPIGSTADEHWTNVDRLPLPGVDQVIDLMTLPWSWWDDSSFDEIRSRHFLEHIGHEAGFESREAMHRRAAVLRQALAVAEWEYTSKARTDAARLAFETCLHRQQWTDQLRSLDGFFAVFAEIWRCLKPSGLTTHEVPYPTSFETISDPTHRRFISPQTLSYLCSPQTQQDYRLPFLFEVVGDFTFFLTPDWRGREQEAIAQARRHWSTVHYWRFTLRKVAAPPLDDIPLKTES